MTKIERIYYVAQLAVAGEAEAEQVRLELLSLIDAAALEALSEGHSQILTRARAAAEAGRTYSVMRAMRSMMANQSEATPDRP